jgi:hypothetical protein
MKSSENVNGAVYNVYTKFEVEITSLKLSKAKTTEIEQFFCLNPGFRSRQILKKHWTGIRISETSVTSRTLYLPTKDNIFHKNWGIRFISLEVQLCQIS